jgi:protein-L-isoaspartate(D-aspartate) O-methyltransferase
VTDLQLNKNRLIQIYKERGLVSDELAFKSFNEVPRELFLPENFASSAYSDRPLPLMDTGQTISAPHMTIMILEYLELKPGLRVLEIGAGPKLVEFARNNIRNAGYEDLITVIEGDGTLGLPTEAPFDRIILTAAGPELPPPLIKQLEIGGILVMPLGKPGLFQTMTRFRKVSDQETTREILSSVAFVPLRGKYGS